MSAGRFLVSVVAILLTLDFASSADLTDRQREAIVKQVVPAYRLGDPYALLESLSPLVSRMNDEQVTAANALLATSDVPPIQRILTEARVNLVQQNQTDRMSVPVGRELLLTLKSLDEQITGVLIDVRKHEVMADPLPIPKSFQKFEDTLWEIHVLNNRLNGAEPVASYAASLTKRRARINQKLLNDYQRKLLGKDFTKEVDEVRTSLRELEEREIEVRIARIEAAEQILATITDPKLRFLSAYVLDLDGELVEEFFKQHDPKANKTFVRSKLNEPGLRETIKFTVQDGQKAAGDLTEKTRLMYIGLHWWARARYGAGPNAFGLMKSREALKSSATMFPLYMPMKTPKPTDPVYKKGPRIPQVDRRHHYAWAVEYRPIVDGVLSTGSKTETSHSYSGEIRTTHMTKFW